MRTSGEQLLSKKLFYIRCFRLSWAFIIVYIMRRPKTYVIDEQQHLENLRKIIKRDFFTSAQQKQQVKSEEAIPMRLNDYIKNFKSSQNQVFAELVQGDAENWKAKHEWMEKSKQLMIGNGSESRPYSNMIAKDASLKAINYGTVDQEAKNAIFFSPTRETKSYNSAEHDKVKHILYDNCKIASEQVRRAEVYETKNTWDPNIDKIPSTPILQGRHRQKNSRAEVHNEKQGYSMKRAPSPQPQKMPIMTWGEIEQTPLRISGEDEYRIPEQPARDKLLDQLATKLVKEKMIKKNKKEDLKFKILSSVRAGASSYRKISVARQASEKREIKKQEISSRLDNLIFTKK